jgi:hypothetical protein
MNDSPTIEFAEVTRYGLFDIQVCVPADWDDDQIIHFADRASPTEDGWRIRTDPNDLRGDPVRNPCLKRPGFVHVILDV